METDLFNGLNVIIVISIWYHKSCIVENTVDENDDDDVFICHFCK